MVTFFQGMCYIHQSQLKSHGSLKPSNLLVDSRFVLKITDYGLHEFKRRTDYLTHHKEDDKFFSRLLWTAPELLRTDYPPPEGTQSGDVYSFAIVLFEIYGRSGPFGNTNLSAREMIAQLRMSNLLTGLFRPPLQTLDNNVADYVVTLITDCWNENPQSRPDFQTIKNCLKPMQSGM
jgi:guanylate cyclase, other